MPGLKSRTVRSTTATIVNLNAPVIGTRAVLPPARPIPASANVATMAKMWPPAASAKLGSHGDAFLHQTPLDGQSGSTYVNGLWTARSPAPEGKLLGSAAFVVGICGIPLFWVPFVNLICPILAMILGTVGLLRAGRTGARQLSAAAGLFLGGILFPVGLFVIDVVLSLAPVLNFPSGASS